jgi:hypothetical protein
MKNAAKEAAVLTVETNIPSTTHSEEKLSRLGQKGSPRTFALWSMEFVLVV